MPCTAAGAHARLVWVRDLDLPLYTADLPVPRPVREFVHAVYACDAMIWSSPTYHGSVSGSFKNALDWLILLAEHDPPYLTNKPVGLVTTAGGVQGLQAILIPENSFTENPDGRAVGAGPATR